MCPAGYTSEAPESISSFAGTGGLPWLSLIHIYISRMIQNRLEDERRGKGGTIIERKLRRQIEEKKQALGIRL